MTREILTAAQWLSNHGARARPNADGSWSFDRYGARYMLPEDAMRDLGVLVERGDVARFSHPDWPRDHGAIYQPSHELLMGEPERWRGREHRLDDEARAMLAAALGDA